MNPYHKMARWVILLLGFLFSNNVFFSNSHSHMLKKKIENFYLLFTKKKKEVGGEISKKNLY